VIESETIMAVNVFKQLARLTRFLTLSDCRY